MEEKLVEMLIEKNLTISTAESCTGGLIASSIVNVSGASSVYNEGYITYANEAKMKILGVKKDTLDKFGAVSEQTVTEMASGLKERSNADITIVSSGIAGPGGGSEDKPVGLVYLACAYLDEIKVVKNIFDGDRQEVRNKAVKAALELCVDMINHK